jgi:hypothetical protein
MCIETRVLTFSFSTTVLQHITAMKCVNGCPKIIVDAGLVADVKFSFLTYTLTLLESSHSFLWGYLKSKACASTVDSEANCGADFNSSQVEAKNTMNFRTLDSSFFMQS